MEIEPKEAATILRIFTSYADGLPLTKIVRAFNEENVPGAIRAAKGWSPATISRILDNEKYAGRWVWNRTESRRDPRTGRRRRFEKPESEWIVREDEQLRIVPKDLWVRVRERRKEMHRTWPGGNGKRGFSGEQGSRQGHFPTHLLAGSMVCGSCGATIAQVSGKNGGYYGCLAATKGACENKTLVRRTLAEKVILEAVKDEIADPEHVAYVLRRVEEEIAKLRSDLPDTLKLREAELSAEQRRLANFVDFIGEGRGSQALAKALVETERRVEALGDEVDALLRSREKAFQAPPVEWIKDRLENLHEVLSRRTGRSAQTLRDLLRSGWSSSRPTSAGRSTGPSRPSTRWHLSKRSPTETVRRAVRILCEGGDGGNRTRVTFPARAARERGRRVPWVLAGAGATAAIESVCSEPAASSRMTSGRSSPTTVETTPSEYPAAVPARPQRL